MGEGDVLLQNYDLTLKKNKEKFQLNLNVSKQALQTDSSWKINDQNVLFDQRPIENIN